MKFKNPTLVSVLFLILLAIITHIVWFNPSSVLTNTDWSHFSQATILGLHSGWATWLSTDNVGGTNIQLPFYGFMFIWSALGHLGFDYDGVTKLTLFIPIAIINFLAPFFLIQYLTKSRFAAVAAAIVYGSTTYGIANQPPIHMVYALTPLLFLTFKVALDKVSIRYWLIFALLFTVSIIYEVRITFLVSLMLLLFALFYLPDVRKNLKGITIAGLLIVLLNIFWILPTLLSHSVTQSISEVADRGLFGNNLFNISHSLSISSWYWTGGVPNDAFNRQPVLLNLWILPIAVFYLIYSASKRKQLSKLWIFSILLAVMGIFLSKQVDAPFSEINYFIYTHVPGFSLFREASKYFLITSFAYTLLVGIGIASLLKASVKPKWIYGASAVLVIIVGLNFIPLINGSIGGLFISRKQPDQYTTLNNFLMNNSQNYRTLWLPAVSRWGFYSYTTPKAGSSFVTGDLKQLTQDSGRKSDTGTYVTSDEIRKAFTKGITKNILSTSSFKYVIVPLRDTENNDDFYKFYSDNRNDYIRLADSLSWLKRVDIGTQDIALYENSSYKPYISASTTMTSVPTTQQLPTVTDLNQSFDYAVNTSSETSAPLNYVSNLSYSLIQRNSQKELSFNQTLPSNYNNVLETLKNVNNFSYAIDNNHLVFSINSLPSLGNQQVVNTDDKIYTLDQDFDYTYSIDDDLYNVRTNDPVRHNIGSYSSDITLFNSQKNTNLIDNGSFENGTWQKTVEDCNDYDNNASISMTVDAKTSTDGYKSLSLGALRHTACTTSNNISVLPGKEYSLFYNYYIDGGQRAGYELRFDDKNSTVLTNDQINSSKSWYTLYKKFIAPEGATHVKVVLKGYRDDNGKNYAFTRYDNIKFKALELVDSIQEETEQEYTQNIVTGNRFKASLKDSSYTNENLIKNPSLETGLWQNKVGDCNAYDNNPSIKMDLDNNGSDGTKSLRLSAIRHVACTGPPLVNVEEGNTYLFSFDYKSPTNSTASYYIRFNDTNGTVYSEKLPSNTAWTKYSKIITAPIGSTNLTLAVYSYADEVTGAQQINDYDNFRITKIPYVQNRFFLTSKPKVPVTLKEPLKISFNPSSSTKKFIHVDDARTPFYLNLSEGYHPQWRLELNDSASNGLVTSFVPWARPNAIVDANHFNYNGFLNSWYIDPSEFCANGSSACIRNSDGSYDLNLIAEFTPQRYFYVGVIVSSLTLVVCVNFLGYTGLKRIRMNHSVTSIVNDK